MPADWRSHSSESLVDSCIVCKAVIAKIGRDKPVVYFFSKEL